MHPYSPGTAPRDIDDRFDALAAAYDDDEIGELDELDPELMGGREISEFDNVLEEFTTS